MFHYFEEKEKVTNYQKKYPEFAEIIEEYWHRHTSISMAEVTPYLESFLTNKIGTPYTVLEKITLKENSIRAILKGTKMYHLTLSYYAVPKDKTSLLHHQIERGIKLYDYQLQKDGKEVKLISLNPNEIELKNEDEKKWKQLEKDGIIFQIAQEEQNVDIDDILRPSTCIGVMQTLDQRKMGINPFSQDILSILISYIEAKNNTPVKVIYHPHTEQIKEELEEFLERRETK